MDEKYSESIYGIFALMLVIYGLLLPGHTSGVQCLCSSICKVVLLNIILNMNSPWSPLSKIDPNFSLGWHLTSI